MEIKENQYINAKIDFGLLGQREVILSNNTNKSKENDPDFNMAVRIGGQLQSCGVAWINTKKNQSSILNGNKDD